MNLQYNFRVVCGLHRSGTSYIGNVLSHNPKVQLVREPLNYDYGLVGAPKWYSYISPDSIEEYGDITAFYRDALDFKGRWSRKPPRAVSTVWRRMMHYLVGGPLGLVWLQMKLRKTLNMPVDTVCWKDPFVTFAIGFLIKCYQARVICMVRHPGAIYASISKQQWNKFDIRNLSSQTTLVRDYGSDVPREHWGLAKTNNAASIAILWKLMSRVIADYSMRFESLLVVRHEDFAREPLRVTAVGCEHFGIQFTEKMKKYVTHTTQAKQVEAPKGVVHFFERDSKALIDAWRNKLNLKDEQVIREIVGNDLLTFYKEW